jgi:catechol 2,3-dioxygenase-like lactoylglutathione lyase family enzyme
MKQRLVQISLVVRDYDEALAFYVGKLGFTLIEDSFVPEQNKRWVVIEPPGANGQGAKLLLARGANEHQQSRIGDQTGGRVFLFLHTDDFDRDYQSYKAKGVEFVREPMDAPYGRVAVFKDLYGTLWDMIGPKPL